MKYRIFIISLIVIVCMCFVNVYADEKLDVQVDKATCAINVSGNLGTDLSNKRVILYCVKANDNNDIETEENVQYSTPFFKIFKQTKTDESGAYLFENLKINSSVGDNYVFYLAVENSAEQFMSDAMYITTVAEINGFLQQMSSGDVDIIYTALEEELIANKIGINIPLYRMLNDTGRYNVATKMAESTYSTISDVETFINTNSIEDCLYNAKNPQDIDKILFADLYSELNDYKAQINENNGFATYKTENPQAVDVLEKLTASEKKKIYNNVDQAEINNVTDFYKSLSINIINYEFANVSGYGDVSAILKKYRTTTLNALNYDAYLSSKYKTNINKDVLKKTFASIDELCNFINSSILSYNNKEQSGAGGGGSGSSSSGRGPSGDSGKYGGSAGLGVSITPATNTSNNTNVFKDLGEYSWAKDAINNLYNKGAVSGTGNNEFKPERKVTREEFVKMLLLAMDYKIESGSCEFGDVANNDWYAPYVFSATKNGLVNGVADEKFGVGLPITREDAAVLIWRVAGKKQADTNGFADSAEVSDYAKDAVNWLKSSGIVSGYEDGTYKPKNLISRAETAKILWTFYEKR